MPLSVMTWNELSPQFYSEISSWGPNQIPEESNWPLNGLTVAPIFYVFCQERIFRLNTGFEQRKQPMIKLAPQKLKKN